MKKLDNKVSVRIAEQFPEFVRADNAGLIPFLERYYEFLESAELTLTGIGASDQMLMEDGVNYIQLQNEDQPTGRQENKIVLEDSGISVFQNNETITGFNSKATATIRVEDINANSRLFISSSNEFIIGEKITGSISGATAFIDTYRANPVENVSNLMSYADVDDTVDTFFNQFKEEFMKTIPRSLAAGVDQRNILKNIKDLYRTKGTRKGHEIFFRLLLDENIELFYPNQNMLRISDGTWADDFVIRATQVNNCFLMEDDINEDVFLTMEDGSHIETEDSTLTTGNLRNLIGQTITQDLVRDVTILEGALHHPDTAGYQGPAAGYSAIEKATATVETIQELQLGSVVVQDIVLNKDSIVGTFVDGQTVYGIDSTDENNTLYAKLAGQLSSITETTSGQYYKTTDLIPVTTRMPLGGVGASANISEISYGSISNIEVSSVGSGYENGDTITVNNTGTSGTGLSAEIAVTNGGFAPETGSLLEQFRFTLESGTPGGTGELITEDTVPLYFNQEEDYGMSATDHIVMEDQTVFFENKLGNKIAQESGSGTGDITDIRVLSIGTNYSSIPTLTLPTAGSRTGGKVVAKGDGTVGNIRRVEISESGVGYNEGPTITPPVRLLLTGVTGSATAATTATGGTSTATGTVDSWDATLGLLTLTSTSGTFTATETVTASGGFSATVAAVEKSVLTATAITAGQFGKYVNEDGWLSEDSKKIQDSFYYQDFSYVVKTSTAIGEWRNELLGTAHPSGFALFGEINPVATLNMQVKQASTSSLLVDGRETQTPELFSLFNTIFTTKFGRRLGTAAETASTTPTTGVSRNTALENAKDTSLTLHIVLDKHIQARALTTINNIGDAGWRIENADTFKFSQGFVKSAANNLTYLSNTGFYENREMTTLDGAINNSATTISLTSAAQFPTSGTIVIGSEQITYTGKSSNDLTGCTRGADIQGTTSAASHADDATVYHFKFISTNNYGYRIQDWGSVTLDSIINYPGTKHNIPAPSEISIGKST